MPLEIVPFESEHIESFRENGGTGTLGNFDNMGKVLAQLGRKETVFSVIVDGKVLAITGILFLWNGVGEAWASFTPEGERYMKSIHRKAKEVIASCLKNGFHRIHADSPAGQEKTIKWIKGLGFEVECIMRKYCPDGNDMIRYAIVKEDDR